MIEVCCPNDGTPHYVDESHIGRQIPCQRCGAMLEVEGPDDGFQEPQQASEHARNLRPGAGSAPTINRKQKWVLICGIVLLVLAGLYLRIPGQGGHDSEIIPVSIPK